MNSLSLHPFVGNEDQSTFHINYKWSGEILIINFNLPNYQYVNPELSKENSQWGLWDWDVFEIFLQKRKDANDNSAPYLELQVSPLNQFFQLQIVKKRELYYSPTSKLFNSHQSVNESWQGEIRIPLEKGKYFVNITSILGKKRNHFAAVGNYSTKPDFHCPELFTPLNLS